MKTKKQLSLRSILTASIVSLTAISLFVGLSLIIITNSLNRVSQSLNRSVESVRLSEEARIALLVHARLREPLARAQSEAAVRLNLQGAGAFVTTESERKVFRSSKADVEDYFLAMRERPPNPTKVAVRLEKAFRTLERLAQINVSQSNAAREEARHLSSLSGVVSVASLGAFFMGVPLILWWINTKAFRPSYELARAMTSFSGGNWEIRAPELGPTELRAMAVHFNKMADALVRQRELHLAFLAGVAHDIRTPLSALRMSAAAVPHDRPLPPEQQIRKMVALVDRQVNRLERLVTDFLETAQIEAGELVLSIARHDLRDLGRSAVDLFASTSSQHQLELEVPESPVWLSCDAERIERVLSNLVSNAIKYSPEGGRVRIIIEHCEVLARVTVIDQGIGISAEDREQLFDPFRRRLGRHDIPGIGLGLFVCQRLVEAHAGNISITSSPGRGSTFVVELPLAVPAVVSE